MNMDAATKALMDLAIPHQKRLNELAIAKAEQELREATAKAETAELVKEYCVKQLGMSDADAALKARKWVT